MSDGLGLGNPLPNYRWPELSWVPLPVWIVIGLQVALLGVFVARSLVRR